MGLSFSTFNVVAIPQAEQQHQQAVELMEKKQYGEAITILEEVVIAEPGNAEYHHSLAIACGREAATANWFSAMHLARKTLEHLEIAANLDRENVEILDDLMDYYREAPRFLGGDRKKADEIESLIKKLSVHH